MEEREPCVSALVVGGYQESQALLHQVFRDRCWRLHVVPDRKRALDCLERQIIQVVIAPAEFPTWPWKRVLQDLRRMPRAPQLVVVSRLADDFLWAEVLNWGGYDVLSEPLQREEVERVISSARRHFDAAPGRGYSAHAAAS